MYSSRAPGPAMRLGRSLSALVLPGLFLLSAAAQAHEEVASFEQPEARDSNGKVTVEASVIHVIECNGAGENGGEYYVYQYTNRPGYRAILPPDWGHPVGGKDFSSYDEAVAAACSATGEGGGAQPPSGAGHLGCYMDDDTRDLNGYSVSGSTNTIEQCVQTCSDRGFAYAAVQYSAYCFCGNTFGRLGPATNCDMPCSGNPDEKCGGAWANDVWATGVATEGGGKAPPSDEEPHDGEYD